MKAEEETNARGHKHTDKYEKQNSSNTAEPILESNNMQQMNINDYFFLNSKKAKEKENSEKRNFDIVESGEN